MIACPKTAMVLSAGLGTRMRPLTDETAKPLIDVAGRRLLDRVLDPLVEAGVERAVVNVHWCADQVEAAVKARDDIEIVISDERSELLETGGAIVKAQGLLGDDPVFIVNTDAFWHPASDAPLRAMADAYDPERCDDLLLLADTRRALGFAGKGDFFLEDDGRLTRRGDAPSAPWAFAGVRIANPKAYAEEPEEPFSANRIWNRLLPEGRVHGLSLDGFWLHVGDPQALKDAKMWLRCFGA